MVAAPFGAYIRILRSKPGRSRSRRIWGVTDVDVIHICTHFARDL